MSAGVDASADLSGLLDEVEAVLRSRGADPELEGLLPGARERALGLAEAAGGTEQAGAGATAVLTFCGEVLSGRWVDRPWTREQVLGLVERLAQLLQLEPSLVSTALYLRAAREQRALELPPHLAIETQLKMLHAFTAVDEASLWARNAEGQLECVVGLGGSAESRRTREIARAILAGEPPAESDRALLHGVPVQRWQQTVGALVVRAQGESRGDALAFAHEAAAAVSPLLHLGLLLDRSAARERALVESTERHLVRLGFDIHDGALQELAALASDVRLFQSQLAEFLPESEQKELVIGRVADLEGRIVAIDAELRELTQSLEAPSALTGSLVDAVRGAATRVAEESDIAADMDVSGDFEDLTASQTIALSRIVQEALTNVAEHSGASRVQVRLRGTRAFLEVEVEDDGRGFDVDERLVEAARGGRLGLIGMAERVRLLGGRLDVDSRPGGPTRVTARIPRWRPPSQRDGGAGGAGS